MPGLTINLTPTLRRWVRQETRQGVEALIDKHGLRQALVDGKVKPDEVALPVDTFRSLSGGGSAITRKTLARVSAAEAQASLVTALQQRFAAIEGGLRMAKGDVTASDFRVDAFDVRAHKDTLELVSLTETYTRHRTGQPPVSRTQSDFNVYASLLLQVAAVDRDLDGRISVFGEMGSASQLVDGRGWTCTSGANPIRTSQDLAALTGGKDYFTADDYVNFLIVSELKAQGKLTDGR